MNHSYIIRAVEFIVCIFVSFILIIAAFPSNYLSFSVEDFDTEIRGSTLHYTVRADAESGLPFSMDDLNVKVSMVDDVRGSLCTIVNVKDEGISPGANMLTFDGDVFLPTAMLMLRDFCSDPDSVIMLRCDISFDYIMGLIRLDTVSFIDMGLSYDGRSVYSETIENDDNNYSIAIYNLRPDLIPDDSVFYVSNGEYALVTEISTEDALHLHIHSDEQLGDAISGLRSSDNLDVVYSGPGGAPSIPFIKEYLELLYILRGV